MYENDFVNEDVVDLNVKDKKGFMYKPTTAGDENEWVDEYTEHKKVMDEESGKETLRYSTNVSKLNICKMRNLVDVPYDDATLEKMSGVKKAWKNMDHQERWTVLSKLKPSVFDQIILAMRLIDKGTPTKN